MCVKESVCVSVSVSVCCAAAIEDSGRLRVVWFLGPGVAVIPGFVARVVHDMYYNTRTKSG